MKTNPSLLSILLLIMMVACQKEKMVHSIPVPVLPKVSEFDSCNCSAVKDKIGNSEYIKATINGIPVCFDQLPSLGDTFPNMLRSGFILRDTGNQYYDNVAMIRNAANSHWQAAMFFENTHALTKTYPYQLPRANPEVCEIGELQLNDLDHYVSCTWCPENNYNYDAPFFDNGVKMTVTSFDNNVFEGVFDGTVRTGSGKLATITNGQFRIKLVVYKEDIAVK